MQLWSGDLIVYRVGECEAVRERRSILTKACCQIIKGFNISLPYNLIVAKLLSLFLLHGVHRTFL